MKFLLKRVMNHPSFHERPPVLIDIGASGYIHQKWELIAKYSICIAFDADDRDFEASESKDQGWRKLISLNRLVAQKSADKVNFYLTQYPHCSSSLPPDQEALKPWAFSSLFKVERIVSLKAVDLQTALSKVGVTYIDWFKTDSQGTDLRIFDSLMEKVKKKTILAEFEPGIIDAYHGEDKLHQLMAYMDKEPFWVTNMVIKGSQRIGRDDISSLNKLQQYDINSFLKKAPGWCEISYLNNMKGDDMGLREYLLAWIFSTINLEHGFALFVAKTGCEKFNDDLFDALKKASYSNLSRGYWRLGKKIFKRLVKKKL